MPKQNKWHYRKRLAVRRKLEEYINKNACPSVSQFAFQNSVPRSQLYKWKELEETIEHLQAKREKYLEDALLSGDGKKVTGAIFALKQMGWSDRNETNHTGEVQHVMVAQLPKRDSIEEWEKQGKVQPKQVENKSE
jgi:hypothetical protein